ncbi:AraC family transcriptional regulator [Luteimonas sp. BDR2-5]|uniref:AraC family transcriptional regulator n=1 Tax=Proluteimonas luteida TaxID=2878685 RepID=UPI001E534009|nr:AraC family transcriptional regulator [Luteimonas sp. BDR2-5]
MQLAFPRSGDGVATTGQQAELVGLIDRFAPAEGRQATRIGPLSLMRASAPTPCAPGIYEPGLGFVAQGSKITMLGGDTYVYDPLNYLVISVTLPMVSQVTEATPEKPYLSLRIDVDPREIADLILEGRDGIAGTGVDRGLYCARVTGSLLDAVLRLLRLLDAPQDIPVLAPLTLREIHYRVLGGELGYRLREVAAVNGRTQRIARAVEALKRDYPQPLNIEALAQSLHMSASSLHHQFKAVTAMSPLQFQKQLRLHEARRLMLVEGLEANTAAHRVGYESASQFNREYKRLFGAPPRRETGLIRAAPA